MRIIANENFPLEAVDALRSQGHDVVWIKTDAPESPDDAILARAVAEDRLVITFDKDFGALAFHLGLTASPGVVLFRVKPLSGEYVARVAAAVLESRTDWRGHFSVVEEGRVRMTPLPPGGAKTP